MYHQEENPFESEAEKQSVWGTASTSNDSPPSDRSTSPQPIGGYTNNQQFIKSNTMIADRGYATNNAYSMSQGKTQRELELDAREVELNIREQKVAEMEKKMETYGIKIPNWPSFKPIIYHDIDAEIPERGKPMIRRLYYTWLFVLAQFFINLIANLCLLISKQTSAGVGFGLSILYLLIGPLFSFSFWYRQAYSGVKQDSSLDFAIFFFGYFVFIGSAVYFAIGMPGGGGAGFLNGMDCLNSSTGSGVFVVISGSLWVVHVALGVYNFKQMISYYRSAGMTLQKAQGQAAQVAAKASLY